MLLLKLFILVEILINALAYWRVTAPKMRMKGSCSSRLYQHLKKKNNKLTTNFSYGNVPLQVCNESNDNVFKFLTILILKCYNIIMLQSLQCSFVQMILALIIIVENNHIGLNFNFHNRVSIETPMD